MKKTVIWLDGALIPWEQATIHVTNHTLHYGSGAFEGIRCYATEQGPAIFRLSDHVNRLLHSFSCFGVPFPWSKESIEQAVIDTVQANRFENCYIRPILFFGAESLLLSPKTLSVHCGIVAIEIDNYAGKEALTIGLSSTRRISPESMPIHNKINGFYVNSILALHEARERGFDEALLLDHEGMIAECSVANIFFVTDGVLKTPPSTSILSGITRSSVLSIAQALSIPAQEEPLSVDTIDHATEAFVCGTAAEITPIKSIENKQFTVPGTITHKIYSAYHALVRGKERWFPSWLTVVH